jgi:hypothetical protein
MRVGRSSARRAGEEENEGKQGEGKKEIAGGDTGAPGNYAREAFHRFGSAVFNND